MSTPKDWDFSYSSSRKLFQRDPAAEVYSLERYSNEDRSKIRAVAKLVFDLLAQQHRLKISRKKYTLYVAEDKEYFRRTSVFGVHLQTLMNSDRARDPQCRLPLVVEMLFAILKFHGYKTDGTMRLSPRKSSAEEVKSLMAEDFYGQRREVERLLRSNQVHLTANIIKFFIRCIPDSLFTKDYANAFLKTADIVSKYDRLKAMKLLIMQLPRVNADVLQEYLLQLRKLIENEADTRMSSDAMARVVTTSLFYVTDAQLDFGKKKLEDCPPFNLVMMMLENVDILFTVPAFINKRIGHPDLKWQMEDNALTKRGRMARATQRRKEQFHKIMQTVKRK